MDSGETAMAFNLPGQKVVRIKISSKDAKHIVETLSKSLNG